MGSCLPYLHFLWRGWNGLEWDPNEAPRHESWRAWRKWSPVCCHFGRCSASVAGDSQPSCLLGRAAHCLTLSPFSALSVVSLPSSDLPGCLAAATMLPFGCSLSVYTRPVSCGLRTRGRRARRSFLFTVAVVPCYSHTPDLWFARRRRAAHLPYTLLLA